MGTSERVILPGFQFPNETAFLRECGPRAIGIEVAIAKPQIIFGEDGDSLIIDHHIGVERRVTQAACVQAWDAVGLGLVEAFTDADGNYRPKRVMRDCDHDVALADRVIELAPHVSKKTDAEIDRLDELVRVEGMLDVFGGVPPGRITRRRRQIMERIAWIFDPYNKYRASGELYLNNAERHEQIIEECGENIDRHIAGTGRSRPLDTRYNEIGRVKNCVVIEAIGAEALLGACSNGETAIIAWRRRPDGSNQYTYFRRSAMVPFNNEALYAACNEIEGCLPGQGHGGSDNMGGSPLKNGSGLDPGAMLRVIANDPRIFKRRGLNGGHFPSRMPSPRYQ